MYEVIADAGTSAWRIFWLKWEDELCDGAVIALFILALTFGPLYFPVYGSQWIATLIEIAEQRQSGQLPIFVIHP